MTNTHTHTHRNLKAETVRFGYSYRKGLEDFAGVDVIWHRWYLIQTSDKTTFSVGTVTCRL